MGRTVIIAEAGVNHNGSLEIAKKLIDAASRAGANYVKFQTFDPKKIVTRSAEMAGYQKENLGRDESQEEMLEKNCVETGRLYQPGRILQGSGNRFFVNAL